MCQGPGTAAKPCPACGCPACPAPRASHPRSTCTTGLPPGAAVYPQRSRLSPCAPMPRCPRALLPRPRQERRGHGVPRAWRLLRHTTTARASQHRENPAPSLDARFPPVPRHPSQRSPTPAHSQTSLHPPSSPPPCVPSVPACQYQLHLKGLMPFLERPPCPSVPPVLASSTTETRHFGHNPWGRGSIAPAARRATALMPGLVPAWHPCTAVLSGAGSGTRAGAGGSARPAGSPVTAVTLQIPAGARSPPAPSIPPGPACKPRSRPGPGAAQENLVPNALSYCRWAPSEGGRGPGADSGRGRREPAWAACAGSPN